MAPLVALLSVAWLAAVVAAPLLPTSIAAFIYAIGSLVCHQLPDRSFHLGAFQLAVCARCVGIYAGGAFGAVTGAVAWALPSEPRRPAFTPIAARWMVAIGALPTAISVLAERAGVWQTANADRAAAGFPLGLTAALVVMSALATLHYKRCVPRRPTVPNPPSSI